MELESTTISTIIIALFILSLILSKIDKSVNKTEHKEKKDSVSKNKNKQKKTEGIIENIHIKNLSTYALENGSHPSGYKKVLMEHTSISERIIDLIIDKYTIEYNKKLQEEKEIEEIKKRKEIEKSIFAKLQNINELMKEEIKMNIQKSKVLNRKVKGFEYEQKFIEICANHKIMIEYIDQDKSSFSTYQTALNNKDIKRPDFYIHGNGKNYIELKRYSIYRDKLGYEYFKFSFKEMMSLERFKDNIKGNDIYILFLDQKKPIEERYIKGITLWKMKYYVNKYTFNTFTDWNDKRKYIKIYIRYLKSFEEFKANVLKIN